jgi:MoaA/NifB/PqqE/SkfB family radical SAM enzyme
MMATTRPDAGSPCKKEEKMEKLKRREHDFGSKLRQESVLGRLKEYILWQRTQPLGPAGSRPPDFGPLCINLDLTSACNFSCPHCVDSAILNSGTQLELENVKKSIDILHEKGLLAVILLGGGEPTIYRNFEETVSYMKEKKLQVGIVTNGSRLDKMAGVVERLNGKDWIRISIDAAVEKTFVALHRPKTGITLNQILKDAKKVKKRNPDVSLGYSFVIIWEGVDVNGHRLNPNIGEMVECIKLARDHSFDYISFKPCLIRLEDTRKESLLDKVDKEKEGKIAEEIRINLEKAKAVAEGKPKILESVNLIALLNGETEKIKKQPRRCHMQFFRTVVSPLGTFHCPAFRGVKKAKIADHDAYVTRSRFDQTLDMTAKSIMTFDAEAECDVIGCFYHGTNWWLEEFIHSAKGVHEISSVEDDNFFL